MHNYLRTVGFAKVHTNQEVGAYLETFIKNPDKEQVVQLDEQNQITVLTRYLSGTDMGIAICGDYDQYGEFRMEYYHPFVTSHVLSCENSLTIRKQGALQAYSALTEDVRIGISLIFYLNNYVDQLIRVNPKLWTGDPIPVALSALASEGKILLPMKKDAEYKKWDRDRQVRYRRLVEEARDGNQESIEQLTLDDMNLYQQIGKRVKKEDMYSIIDTYFMPSGIESDQYSFMGEITEVRTWVNDVTGEQGYHLQVLCNHMPILVTINESDLFGEPAVGRRIKGQIWMQGTLLEG